MTSSPISALTSMNRVERGRWKLVIRPVDRPEAVPGVMKIAVSPSNGWIAPVVGRAFEQAQRGRADGDQPPAGSARGVEAVGRPASMRPHSACIRARPYLRP